MTRCFPAAQWSRSVQIASPVGTVLVIRSRIGPYRAIPTAAGFSHGVGVTVALLFPAIILLGLRSSVSRYVVDGSDLLVRRLFWSTRIPLSRL